MADDDKAGAIYVCTNLRVSGASCAGRGGGDILKALHAEAKARGGAVVVKSSVCMGHCAKGPNVKIRGGGFHHEVRPGDAAALVAAADPAKRG
ncbi:MAG: (2Fe-2S) ferredoxin domain-containing protein [Alphaproteobacteria bacterium]|nr:(2Fe-2S) ferredoxin domain-containing protein [Alphaproteobacteria bacterium]MBF0251743.1 (2Fe-2S) ferredoxin domain-containing protein [Alphaproteobacteria bacterium]